MEQNLAVRLAEPSKILSRSARWALVAAAWTIPGLAALSYYYLNQTVSAQPMSWPYALVSTLPNWYIWALMTPAILWLGRRYRIDRSNWKRSLVTIHIPAMIVCMLVHSLANLLLFHLTDMPGHEAMSAGLYQVHFTTRVHANFLAYWTILGVFYAYDYYQKLRLREQQAAFLQIRLAQANLKALKMQLHPHFLFNTLNSIAALVRKSENQTAIKMLVQLGDFLRLALENKGVQEIPLRQELDFLRKYLDIEKIRFQERLEVTIDVDGDTLEAFVPNMILQPLVENAIHHGIAPSADAGIIKIQAHVIGSDLNLSVYDDGAGLTETNRSARRGVGLNNTRERLENLYGENFRFLLENAFDRGTIARVSIPLVFTPVMKSDNLETVP